MECQPCGGNLLEAEGVEAFQRIPFILKGYRPVPIGTFNLLRTLLTLHNETGNIWTHLLGFLLFAVIGVHLFTDFLTDGEMKMEALWLLLLVVATCFMCFSSACYHLCLCGSRCMGECVYKIDLTGIAALITISYLSGIALGLQCFPWLRCFYLVYALCVAACLVAPLFWSNLIGSWWVPNMPRHFIVCVAAGLVPAIHFVCLTSYDDVITVVPYLLLMFGCYGMGAVFFVTRWPECSWPGRFDIFGQSHQIWHIFVVLAALSWVWGCRVFMHRFNKDHCEQYSGREQSIVIGSLNERF